MFRNITIHGQTEDLGPEMASLPKWVDRCVVLGAGASAGFDDSLARGSGPPTTDQLLSSTRSQMLLRLGRYAELRFTFHRYCSALNVDAEGGSVDVEEFAAKMATTIDRFFTGDPRYKSDQERSEASLAQVSLGELWFFLFELFQFTSRDYFLHQDGTPDNYRLLAKSFRKQPFAAITLNYDDLLEQAILREGLEYSYQGDAQRNSRIPIFKVHGSVTWLNPNTNPQGQAGFLFAGASGLNLFRNVATVVYGSSIQLAPPQFLTPEAFRATTVDGALMPNDRGWAVPAMLPPVGKFKNYEQVGFYRKTWEGAAQALEGAQDVAIIGTKLREEDTALADLLRRALRPSSLTAIVGNVGVIEARLQALTGSRLPAGVTRLKRFGEWAHGLVT